MKNAVRKILECSKYNRVLHITKRGREREALGQGTEKQEHRGRGRGRVRVRARGGLEGHRG